MSDNITDETNEKISKIVDHICEQSRLPNSIKGKPERKMELTPILEKVVLLKDKPEIKKNLKELIEKLKKFGEEIYTGSETSMPVLWSNGRPESMLENSNYNSEFHHHDDTASPLFRILWEIMGNLTHDDSYFIKDSYCHQLYDSGAAIGVEHIPYDRLLSEIWVEEIPLDAIFKGNIRIEFGQNKEGYEAEKIYSVTDSVMILSELPILLDRIAKHNIDMDLAGTPEKKVYLENIGVSLDEIISGKYKTISERYGNGRNNEGAGWIVLRKVKRDRYSEDGEIYGEYTKLLLN